MSTIIKEVAETVIELVNEVLILKSSYDYPLKEIPKPYPALQVLYSGFDRIQDEDDMDAFVYDLKYQLTLYLPNDGRNMDSRWEELNALVWTLILRFANDRTLGGICRQSVILSGDPVVHLNEAKVPVGLGHTFSLIARVETAID